MKNAALLLPLVALASATQDEKPLVDSKELQELIDIDGLMAGSQKLQDLADAHGGNRAFGSGGHNATVDYLYDTLKKLDYYDVVKQPFTEIYSAGTSKLTINGEEVSSGIMTYTPGAKLTAPLVKVANLGCAAADFPAEVKDKIALIKRGECAFGAKSTNAKAAGAVGAIVYNSESGSLSGTLGAAFGDYAPIVGVSKEDGEKLVAALETGEVTVDFDVNATTEKRVNYNVIAETKGGDHNNVLVLGGHSDSVAAGPGINDDGSGTIGVLNVAVALSKFRVNNAVRFAFWGAEEFGKLGSYYYIKSINGSDAEVAKIRAYLNFDMIASPNYIFGVYDGDGSAFNLTGPAGSDVIEKDFEKFFKDNKKASVPSEFSGRSDYAAFIENGIPSGGLFTGAEVAKTEAEAKLFGGEAGVAYDINYHKIDDDINNLNKEAYLLNSKAIANSVAKYAKSFCSLPKGNKAERRWDADRAQHFKRTGAHAHAHSGPCGGGPAI